MSNVNAPQQGTFERWFKGVDYLMFRYFGLHARDVSYDYRHLYNQGAAPITAAALAASQK